MVITPSKFQLPCKLCTENLRTQTLKYIFQTFFSNLLSLNTYFCMILCAFLQLLYKLIQLSMCFSFNMSKLFETLPDNWPYVLRFSNYGLLFFFQVASNCYFRNIVFVFAVFFISLMSRYMKTWIKEHFIIKNIEILLGFYVIL